MENLLALASRSRFLTSDDDCDRNNQISTVLNTFARLCSQPRDIKTLKRLASVVSSLTMMCQVSEKRDIPDPLSQEMLAFNDVHLAIFDLLRIPLEAETDPLLK